ncbi:MAG TPA: hypothetical protein DER09_03455 [Prolixibacteraceae bacterium]|nr:hypothetical protein [Prolixibacteraceae bacterium]
MRYFLRLLKLLSALLFILISIAGCTDDGSESFSIGEKYLSNQTSVTLIDTFSLGLSTILIDSISTTSPDNFLVGSFTDEYFGKMETSAWFQIDKPDSVAINEESVFDSLTIQIRLNGLSYGDTLQPFTLSVHRVTETMEAPDEVYFYNTTHFQYDENPIGSVVFNPRPNRDNELEFRLNDALGAELMKFLLNKSDEIASTDNFLEYFKGLVLLGGSDSKTVLGIAAADSVLSVVLHTHYIGEEREEIEYNFPIYTSGAYFNNIEGDRTGTEIQNLLTQKEEIPASLTGDKTFIQAGTGILTRIDFSSLTRIMEIEDRYIFYKAELILKPFPKSNCQVDFPGEVIMYSTDKSNRIISVLTDSDSETITAEFGFDSQYNEANYYKLDITDFVNDELSDAWVDPNSGLVLSFPDETFTGSLDRVVFDARQADAYRPLLKLYFVFYQ